MNTLDKYNDTLDKAYNKILELRQEIAILKEALKNRDGTIREREAYIRTLKREGRYEDEGSE